MSVNATDLKDIILELLWIYETADSKREREKILDTINNLKQAVT